MRNNRSRRKPDELRPAGEILAGVLAGLGLNERLREREAMLRWEEVVGPEIASKSSVLRIRDGILFIKVDSAAWRQELGFMKRRILDSYERQVGPGLVRDIRFTDH